MFDFDRWLEIGQTLGRHKLRTILTAFGVSWGIFMLIVMLGVGKGVERGVMSMYSDVSTNSVWIYGGKTLMPFRGLLPGREILLDLDDVELLRNLPGVDLIAPVKMLSGNYTMLYGRNSGSFPIHGINADYGRIEKLLLSNGRQLNELDNSQGRKVTVIGARISEVLFGEKINPLGKTVSVSGVPFKVIGVYKKALGEQQSNRFFIPLKTLQSTFDPSLKLTQIILTIAPSFTWLNIKPEAAKLLARRHAFDVRDIAAFESFDISDEVSKLQALMNGIRWFVLMVGTGTLLAGCVGVSNTMLVTVKERTREIGIRKALGATPNAILSMILQETLLITLGAGYIGLLAGVGLIELLRRFELNSDFFQDPQVDLPYIFGALVVLTLTGMVAGYLPARQAVRISPIEALRHE